MKAMGIDPRISVWLEREFSMDWVRRSSKAEFWSTILEPWENDWSGERWLLILRFLDEAKTEEIGVGVGR